MSENQSAAYVTDVDYGICEYPSMGDDLDSKAMSVTTMAVVNPYTKNVDASKAVARAISYARTRNIRNIIQYDKFSHEWRYAGCNYRKYKNQSE